MPSNVTDATGSGQPARSVGVALVAAAAVGFGLNPVLAQVAFEAGVPTEVTTLARYLVPALLLGRLFFGARVTIASAVAAAAVACGAAVAIGPGGVEASQLPPLLAALVAPLAWAMLLLLISTTLRPVPLVPLVSMVFLGASMGVVPFLIATGASGWSPTVHGTGWLLALGTVGVLIPALLVTAGGPMAGPIATGLVGAFEFVVALGVSWLVFGDPIGIRTLAGATLLIGGVAIVATTPSARS